ncbi:MAG TPA: SdrD B-like domain-containing protein [Tepidisphaeraceae bacterium]|jgi:subtilase family serine protease
MRSTRRSATRKNCLLAAIDQLEPRRLLTGLVSSIATSAVTGAQTAIAMNNSSSGDFSLSTPFGYTPQQIRTAYGVDQIEFNSSITGDGTGQTIAIVDAYDDPTAATDLHAFDAYFNLPDPPTFEKLNGSGLSAPLPSVDPVGQGTDDWEMEESLDIEWAHSMAPKANILLVEANSQNPADLIGAVAAAAKLPGVDVISMSWGFDEWSTETSYDSDFTTPTGKAGVTFVAAAGDSGAFERYAETAILQPTYPAASPNVLSVGGTSLYLNADNSYNSETAWGFGDLSFYFGGGGGGISQYEAQPAYQQGVVDSFSTTQRVYPDVSMVADPDTGVPIYDSYDFGASTPWTVIGGTSLAAPLWAGLISIVDQGRGTPLDGPTQTLPDIYNLYRTKPGDFNDITEGSSGYPAQAGYDLSTGLGTPVANLLVPDLAQGQFITGTVFADNNADSVLDNGETGLRGVTVSLYNPGADNTIGGTDDTLVNSTTSSSYGTYVFFVEGGSYYVNVQLPAGYYFSPQKNITSGIYSNVNPATGDSSIFTMSVAVNNQEVSAGLIATNVKISGVVWNDSDVNATTYLPDGILDSGETGPAGSIVSLYNSNGTLVNVVDNPQTTGNGGGYSFSSLAPGSYYIVVTAPDGYLFTIQDAGTDPTHESVVDQGINDPQNAGKSPIISLTNNQQALYENAGIYLPRVYIAPATAQTPAAGDTSEMSFSASLHLFPGQTITEPVLLEYQSLDESAVSGTDYENANGTSEFDPGVANSTGIYYPAANPTVTLIGSNVSSADKVFLLNVVSSNSMIVDPTVTGTIVPGTPVAITVDATHANVTATPAGVEAYFTIQLAAPVNADVTIDYTLGATGDTAVGATPAEIENGSVKLNSVDYVAPALSGMVTIPAGTSTVTLPVLVLDNFTAGNGLSVDNQLDKTFTLTLSNATEVNPPNGVFTPLSISNSTSVGNITADLVQNLNITGTGTVYTDNSGNRVSITLSGPGTAAVQRRGGENSDGVRIVLSGTTAGSVLNIQSSGQTSIAEIDDDSPLGSINASKVNLTGSMALSGGLGQLRLNSITPTNVVNIPGVTLAPGVQITIGGGPLGTVTKLNAKVGRVTDATIDSGIPIASLKVASFNNQNGEPSQISAPAVGNLNVAGNFQEDIQTNTITRLNVRGAIQNSNIRAAVSIGPVTAASLSNSTIFAGISSSTTGLPTSDAAFTAGSFIKSVKLRGKSATFSNSDVAAAIVGPLQLGNVVAESDVPYYGVAGLELISVRGSTGTLFSIPKETADLGTVFSSKDFLIQVYGI